MELLQAPELPSWADRECLAFQILGWDGARQLLLDVWHSAGLATVGSSGRCCVSFGYAPGTAPWLPFALVWLVVGLIGVGSVASRHREI